MISQPIRHYSTSDLFEKENPAFKTFHTCLALFYTELYTLTPLSVTSQTGGVEPFQGISFLSESVKKTPARCYTVLRSHLVGVT